MIKEAWGKISACFWRDRLPDDYFYNPERHTGLARGYLQATKYSRDLVENETFNYFIVLVICLAGVNVGIQSYPQLEDVLIFNIIDLVILIVFATEVIVKILSEGLAPYMYFFGSEWKWNNFDFAIVFLSLPFWGGLFGGGSLALLRLVRLMRLAKLVKKIPALNMIIEGLSGGLSSLGYIMLLLFLVFYLFGVVGVIMFSRNDPFHFGSIDISMVTLFRCATMDAWSDVMYLSMFSCEGYDYLYVSTDDRTDDNKMFWCEHPKKSYILSSIFFVSFTIICALVMLSLVIGAVTVSMNESLSGLNDMIEESRRKEKFDRAVKDMFLAQSRIEIRARQRKSHLKHGTIAAQVLERIVSMDFSSDGGSGEVVADAYSCRSAASVYREQSAHLALEAVHEAESDDDPFSAPTTSIDKSQDAAAPMYTDSGAGQQPPPGPSDETALSGDSAARDECPPAGLSPECNSENDPEDNSIAVSGSRSSPAESEETGLISADGAPSPPITSMPLGIGRIVELRNQHNEEMHERNQSLVKRRTSFGMFSKILDSQHSISDYGHTSHSKYEVDDSSKSVGIDGSVDKREWSNEAIVNLVRKDRSESAALAQIDNSSSDHSLRKDCSARSTTSSQSDSNGHPPFSVAAERKKLVRQSIMMPITKEQQSLRNRALAQMGQSKRLIISGRSTRSTSPLQTENSSSDSAMSSSALASSKVRRMSSALASTVPQLEDLSFAKRPFATFLPNVFLEALDYIEHEKSRKRNQVIGYKLRVALGELPEGLEDGEKSWASFYDLVRKAPSIMKKYHVVAGHCKYVTEHPKFVALITFFIVLAGINVGAQTDSRIIQRGVIRNISNILDKTILSVFTMEVGLKIIGEGTSPWAYFGDNWNKFDFVVVAGSYAPGAGSLLTILRLLRLLRVLKLVKSLPQLEVIVNALLMGMNSIAYIGLILFLCFYVFAILGMILFKQNDPFHFGNLHIAMFTLFRCSTLDDWSEVMYVNMFACDRYLGVYEDFPELCTQPEAKGVLAAVYFIAFIIVGAQVLLTLFIGVVTTSMEQAKDIQDKEHTLTRRLGTLQRSLKLSDVQMKYFQEVFNTLDLDGGGMIEIEEIELSFSTINELFCGFDVQRELANADVSGEGIDLITFILIMASVPAFKYKRMLRRNIKHWISHRRRTGQTSYGDITAVVDKKVATKEEMYRRFDRLLARHGIPVHKNLTRRRSGSWVAENEHEMTTLRRVVEDEHHNALSQGDQWIEKVISASPEVSRMCSLSQSQSHSFHGQIPLGGKLVDSQPALLPDSPFSSNFPTEQDTVLVHADRPVVATYPVVDSVDKQAAIDLFVPADNHLALQDERPQTEEKQSNTAAELPLSISVPSNNPAADIPRTPISPHCSNISHPRKLPPIMTPTSKKEDDPTPVATNTTEKEPPPLIVELIHKKSLL